MVFQIWVVVVDIRVILVAPCTGNGRSFPDRPLFHMLETPRRLINHFLKRDGTGTAFEAGNAINLTD